MSLQIAASFLQAAAAEPPRVAVRLTPSAAAAAAATRRPFHLALLLDVSGSMEGARIASLKTTLHLLLDALAPDDSLTLIKYESAATALLENRVIGVSSRDELHMTVDNLCAEGGTNLEAALVRLHEVTRDTTTPIDAVFLLTDGHINQGLTASSGLLRMLNAAVPVGTPVNTLGYGADHHAVLLRDMATRSRGLYAYADAAEVLPATIGDIVGGLATEVGRHARLQIPEGWRCLELDCTAEDREYVVGTLVADKVQWVVLEGPAADTAAGGAGAAPLSPTFTVEWRCGGVEMRSHCAISDEIASEAVAEQLARARVANVFSAVTRSLETRNIAEATAALEALGAELDASPARDRVFVVQLRAQVDEMLEGVRAAAPTLPAYAPALRGGARAYAPALRGMPSMAPLLTRMASNTAALGCQRGFLSSAAAEEDPDTLAVSTPSAAPRGPSLRATFSSPQQQSGSRAMTNLYSSISSAAAPSQSADPSTRPSTPSPSNSIE